MVTEAELNEAKAREREANRLEPRIVSAVVQGEQLTLSFGGGAIAGTVVRLPARALEGLKDAPLERFEITPSGDAIHWPQAGVYLQTVSLVRDIFGLCAVTASEMGKRGGVIGGAARTQAKSQASRANGAKGGRPRKVTA